MAAAMPIATGVVRSFQQFMDSLPALWFYLPILFFVMPWVGLAHEVGHAAVAALRLPERATVIIGREPPLATFAVGGLDFKVRPMVVPWRFDLRCEYGGHPSRADAILIALAGPAASLVTGLAALEAAHALNGTILRPVFAVAALASLSSTVLCLVPMTLRQGADTMHSDGMHVLAALRSRRLSGMRL